MTTILVARHGETDWNRDRRFQGHADPPLNATGRQQAQRLAETLAGAGLRAVYTSPLARALQTAEIVARQAAIDVQTEPALREVDVGEWTGLTVAEIEERFPARYASWLAFKTHGWEGGESYEALAARVIPALHAMAARHPAETVLVVTHGGPIRAIAAAIAGLDPLAARRAIPVVQNCEVAAVAIEDGTLREGRWSSPAVYCSEA